MRMPTTHPNPLRAIARLARRCRAPLLAVALAATVAAPLQAKVGALDEVPAATLLLPYFAVDLGNPNGAQTRFSITNLSADPQLAHVQLWTDYAVPSFGFDVYLGGRDTIEVDLRMVFEGVLPRSGPGISGQGSYSAPDMAFNGCGTTGSAPDAVSLPVPDRLPDDQRVYLRKAHTGQPVLEAGNRCMSHPRADAIARGYVTVDVSNSCTLLNPRSPGYFAAGGTGVAANRNVLTGSFTLIERGQGQYAASPLVHIEADGGDPLTTTPGEQTFYGRHVGGTAIDNREPLGTVWQARSIQSGHFDAGTDVIAWRDSGTPVPAPACGSLSGPFPLAHTQIAGLDEEENLQVLGAENTYPNPPSPPYLGMAFATQLVSASELSPFDFGYLQLNLNAQVPSTPYAEQDLMQSVVLVRHARAGAHAAMVPAMRLLSPRYHDTAAACDWMNFPRVCSNTSVVFF